MKTTEPKPVAEGCAGALLVLGTISAEAEQRAEALQTLHRILMCETPGWARGDQRLAEWKGLVCMVLATLWERGVGEGAHLPVEDENALKYLRRSVGNRRRDESRKESRTRYHVAISHSGERDERSEEGSGIRAEILSDGGEGDSEQLCAEAEGSVMTGRRSWEKIALGLASDCRAELGEEVGKILAASLEFFSEDDAWEALRDIVMVESDIEATHRMDEWRKLLTTFTMVAIRAVKNVKRERFRKELASNLGVLLRLVARQSTIEELSGSKGDANALRQRMKRARESLASALHGMKKEFGDEDLKRLSVVEGAIEQLMLYKRGIEGGVR